MHVYLITDLLHGKQYIGAEKGNNSDYFGSGRLIREAIEKFGKRNFKKRILIDDKYIDNWKECREFESACKLSFNTLVPNGYNIALWEYPLSVEMCIKGGKIAGRIAKELGTGIHAPGMYSKAGKIGGKITGKIIKELGIGVCAPGIASKGGEIGGKIGGKIAGKKNLEKWKREDRERFLEYQRVAGKKTAKKKKGLFDPANKEKVREGGRKGGRINGKNRAYTLFEIDGLIQRTILGAILRM